MPRWRPLPTDILNPEQPTGAPMPSIEEGQPWDSRAWVDVPIEMPDDRKGARKRSAEMEALRLSHAVHCRVTQVLVRVLHGPRGVGERLQALSIGYGDPVARLARAAVFSLTDRDADRFDARVARALAALGSRDRQATALDRQVALAILLKNAHQDASEHRRRLLAFKRTNVDSGKGPREDRIVATFTPVRSRIVDGVFEDQVRVAVAGLANPASIYLDFWYLREPLELLTWIGRIGLYNAAVRRDQIGDVEALRQRVELGEISAGIQGHEGQTGHFRRLCARALQEWAAHDMDQRLMAARTGERLGDVRPMPSSASARDARTGQTPDPLVWLWHKG